MSDFNLGTVTAYGYAKDKGYTGTEDEYAELMASYADVAEQAAESAEQAAASATTATAKASEAAQSATAAASSKTAAETAQGGAETAAQTATTKAGEATTAATTATNKATEATTAATTATGKATEAAGSATTATTKAGEASTSATNAAASATRAQEILDSIPEDYSQMSEDVADLKDGLTQMITVSYSDNRLDPNLQIAADINTSTGVVTPSDYYSVSGKMPCEYGENLYVVSKATLTNEKSAAIRMAFYTSGDSFIEIQQDVSPFVVPQNAAYCLLRTNRNQIIQEKVGVFPYSGTTMTAWIPYSVTKTLSDDYAPLELSSEVASNTEKTAVISVACGENLFETLELSQSGTDNIVSNRFPVKAEVTYTFSYDGAVDNATAGYIQMYELNAPTRSQYVYFPFKQGYVTFTPPENIVEAELYFYNPNGLSVDTFTLSNPRLAYGSQQIGYVPYKEKLAASTIPTLPDRLYTNKFSAMQSVAHMGQSYYFPQNTIWSWLGAKKSGFDYIECDLQVTSDGYIVLIHDSDMRRYGGTAQQTVASLTLEQLRQFDAGAWFNEAYRGTEFPLFDDMVGVAKSLGIKLALDCKTIDTAERVDTVATILEKWGMIDEVIWITGNYALVWNRVPNAEIWWAAGATLIDGSFAETPGGWFNNYASNFPATKKQQKTVVIDVNGIQTEVTGYVAADGVKFGVMQNHTVGDTYGLSSLQTEAQYAKAFGVMYELYAVDSDDEIYNYIQSIPELAMITSNRTTPQAASCRKFGIGLSDRPQNIGEADFT